MERQASRARSHGIFFDYSLSLPLRSIRKHSTRSEILKAIIGRGIIRLVVHIPLYIVAFAGTLVFLPTHADSFRHLDTFINLAELAIYDLFDRSVDVYCFRNTLIS